MSRKGVLGLWVSSLAVFGAALKWGESHPEMRVVGRMDGSPLFTAVTILLLLMLVIVSFLVLLNVVAEVAVGLMGTAWLGRLSGTVFERLLWDELKDDRPT